MNSTESVRKFAERLVEDTAADWVVREIAGLSAAETVERDAWLAADARHAKVFAEAKNAWRVLKQPRVEGRAEFALASLAAREKDRVGRRRVFQFASGVLAAAAALVLAFALPDQVGNSGVSGATTVVHRPDRQVLPDGSTVELNAGAKIEVAYTAEKRSVRLLEGEALFSVAKNPVVPFVVSAAGVEVRAVGTAFVVSHGTEHVNVLVTEGRVAVARVSDEAQASTASSAAPLYLYAGLQVKVPTGLAAVSETEFAPAVPVTPVSESQIAAALAWRDLRVEFTGTTLAEAIELFNRKNEVHLSLEDNATGRLQLTGIFWADDIEAFVRLLDSGLDVESSRSGNEILLRRR